MTNRTLLDHFLRRRKAQQIAPTPAFQWRVQGALGWSVLRDDGPVLRVAYTGVYQGRVYQGAEVVAETNAIPAMAGDQIRLDEYAPTPTFKMLPPFVRRARIALKRWAIFR